MRNFALHFEILPMVLTITIYKGFVPSASLLIQCFHCLDSAPEVHISKHSDSQVCLIHSTSTVCLHLEKTFHINTGARSAPSSLSHLSLHLQSSLYSHTRLYILQLLLVPYMIQLYLHVFYTTQCLAELLYSHVLLAVHIQSNSLPSLIACLYSAWLTPLPHVLCCQRSQPGHSRACCLSLTSLQQEMHG